MNSKIHSTEEQRSLFLALLNGDFEKFCQLIEDGANINCISNKGEALISNIVENKFQLKNNKKFFNKLMSLNVSFQHGKNECDLLSTAIRFQPDIYYMEKLLEKGIKINYMSCCEDIYDLDNKDMLTYGPSIYEAITSFDTKKIDLLLKYKPDLEMCNSDNMPLLSFLLDTCCYHKKIVDYYFPILMIKGASIYDTDLDGRQPIHYCAEYNQNIEIFDLLIKNNVNINARDKHGNTPLMYAAMNYNYKSASILLKNNADLNLQNKHGRTAIMITMAFYIDSRTSTRENVDIKMINFFLKSKYNLLLCDNNSENFAHYLARCPKNIWNDKTIKKYSKLFNKHPKLISQKNKDGKTPMDILKNKNKKIHSEFMKLIENNTSIAK